MPKQPWQASQLSIQAGLWRQRAGEAGQPDPLIPGKLPIAAPIEDNQCDAAVLPYLSRGIWTHVG